MMMSTRTLWTHCCWPGKAAAQAQVRRSHARCGRGVAQARALAPDEDAGHRIGRRVAVEWLSAPLAPCATLRRSNTRRKKFPRRQESSPPNRLAVSPQSPAARDCLRRESLVLTQSQVVLVQFLRVLTAPPRQAPAAARKRRWAASSPSCRARRLPRLLPRVARARSEALSTWATSRPRCVLAARVDDLVVLATEGLARQAHPSTPHGASRAMHPCRL